MGLLDNDNVKAIKTVNMTRFQRDIAAVNGWKNNRRTSACVCVKITMATMISDQIHQNHMSYDI
jgi:hypothetical protein